MSKSGPVNVVEEFSHAVRGLHQDNEQAVFKALEKTGGHVLLQADASGRNLLHWTVLKNSSDKLMEDALGWLSSMQSNTDNPQPQLQAPVPRAQLGPLRQALLRRDHLGDTPLLLAAKTNSAMKVYLMTKLDPWAIAWPSKATSAMQTAADQLASSSGRHKTSEVMNAMMLGCIESESPMDVTFTRDLLSKGAVADTWAPSGLSALQLASRLNKLKIMIMLLNRQPGAASGNSTEGQQGEKGEQASHPAGPGPHEGADINMQDTQRRTPLIHAAINDRHEAVQLLLAFGAEVSMRDAAHKSAIDYAPSSGKAHELLKRHLAMQEEQAARAEQELLKHEDSVSKQVPWNAEKADRAGRRKKKRAGAQDKRGSKDASKDPSCTGTKVGGCECQASLIEEADGRPARAASANSTTAHGHCQPTDTQSTQSAPPPQCPEEAPACEAHPHGDAAPATACESEVTAPAAAEDDPTGEPWQVARSKKASRSKRAATGSSSTTGAAVSVPHAASEVPPPPRGPPLRRVGTPPDPSSALQGCSTVAVASGATAAARCWKAHAQSLNDLAPAALPACSSGALLTGQAGLGSAECAGAQPMRTLALHAGGPAGGGGTAALLSHGKGGVYGAGSEGVVTGSCGGWKAGALGVGHATGVWCLRGIQGSASSGSPRSSCAEAVGLQCVPSAPRPLHTRSADYASTHMDSAAGSPEEGHAFAAGILGGVGGLRENGLGHMDSTDSGGMRMGIFGPVMVQCAATQTEPEGSLWGAEAHWPWAPRTAAVGKPRGSGVDCGVQVEDDLLAQLWLRVRSLEARLEAVQAQQRTEVEEAVHECTMHYEAQLPQRCLQVAVDMMWKELQRTNLAGAYAARVSSQADKKPPPAELKRPCQPSPLPPHPPSSFNVHAKPFVVVAQDERPPAAAACPRCPAPREALANSLPKFLPGSC